MSFTKNNLPTSVGGSIGRITLTGEVSDLPLGNRTPRKIVAGSDGNLWFTTTDNNIGRLTLGAGGRLRKRGQAFHPRKVLASRVDIRVRT